EAAAYWMGWCDYALGNFDLALKEFQAVNERADGQVKARSYWAAAEAAYEMKRYNEATVDYQKALDSGNSETVVLNCYSGLGWSSFQQEKYTDAIAAFQK